MPTPRPRHGMQGCAKYIALGRRRKGATAAPRVPADACPPADCASCACHPPDDALGSRYGIKRVGRRRQTSCWGGFRRRFEPRKNREKSWRSITSSCTNSLCQFVRETALLAATESTLGWDERTMMPPAGGRISGRADDAAGGYDPSAPHRPAAGRVAGRVGRKPAGGRSHSDAGTTIRQLKRDYDKRVKLPQSLVEELTRTASLGQHAWQTARAENDFSALAPAVGKDLRAQAAAGRGAGL